MGACAIASVNKIVLSENVLNDLKMLIKQANILVNSAPVLYKEYREFNKCDV